MFMPCEHPLLLICFWVLCIFAWPTIWSSLQICQTLLVRATLITFFYIFICIHLLTDRPNYTTKLHGILGLVGCIEQLKVCFASKAVKNQLGLIHDSSSWRKCLGQPTAVDSSLGLTSLNIKCTCMILGSHDWTRVLIRYLGGMHAPNCILYKPLQWLYITYLSSHATQSKFMSACNFLVSMSLLGPIRLLLHYCLSFTSRACI